MNQRLLSGQYGQTTDEFLASVEAATGFRAGTVELDGQRVRGYLLQRSKSNGWQLVTDDTPSIGGYFRRYYSLSNDQLLNLPILRSLGIEP